MISAINREKKNLTTLAGIYYDLGGRNNKVITSTDKEFIQSKIDKLKKASSK